ncbi:T6SS effector phospholipase Tle3 domain-containing protein [Pseudomonas plecoglossicida]|uniref:T6SS effector phospholipase Tle3 domain-containing protein n=1 Tax=Pseudomonas plecoglossicida TaxID=70775 RepID=UPI003D212DFF
MSGDQYAVAESVTRLVPNFSTERKMEVPADLPGVVIFLHGVNDPGASYESVETGLCQGVNERLDRPDLKAGRYGAAYSAAKKRPVEEHSEDDIAKLDDPDTYLYRRDTADPKTRSLMIPFYWGYRAEPGEIKRDKNNDPTKLRDQYQDVFENRLDRHFAKGGGFFANATNNLLEMYSQGFAKFIRHAAQITLSNTQFMGKGPHRRYFVLAATRLAMLVSEIRRVSPDETITIMGHSQGTLITLLAQAMLIDKGQRCADTVIMVDTPYSVLPKATPKGHDTLATLINIATAVTQASHAQPPLSALRDSKTYGGRTGPRWSPTQGSRADKVGNLTVFPERDNRGKVYLYFCPDDTTVALDDVHGIGTYGVPNTLPDGKPAMAALQSLRFYQRLWTKRHRDGEPVLVGDAIQQTVLRAEGEPRYPGGWSTAAAASRAPIAKGEERLINAEALIPPHAPQMFGGEAVIGTPTQAGLDSPDDVSIRSALGNPLAEFKWFKVRTSPFLVDLEKERARWNTGKEPGDQTAGMRHQLKHGNPMANIQDYYVILREETPNEIQARMPADPNEMDPNSYHSAVLRSPENQRWVTAMDIAIGQAHSLDDPAMREVLVAIADWKMDQKTFSEITKLPGWSRLSGEAQGLVIASNRYYQLGLFPSSGLVSLTPPSLVANATGKGVGR